MRAAKRRIHGAALAALLLLVATSWPAAAKAGPAAGAAGSGSPLLAAVDVGLGAGQDLDVAALVDVGAGVELALQPPRSWTYLDDLARLSDDVKWRLEVDVQGLAGGCLEPSARLKTRVRGYKLFRGGNKAFKNSLIPYAARDCEPSCTAGPVRGVFLTTDPLGYVDGPNLYQFALNNPVNYSDPMGLRCMGLFGGSGDKCTDLWPHFDPGYWHRQRADLIPVTRDLSLNQSSRNIASAKVNAQIPFFLAEELFRGIMNIPYSVARGSESSGERWVESLYEPDPLERVKLRSQSIGDFAFAFVEAAGAVEGVRLIRFQPRQLASPGAPRVNLIGDDALDLAMSGRRSPYLVRVGSDGMPLRSIDTALFTSGETTMSGGIRNSKQFWRAWRDQFGDTLSRANRELIDAGSSPVVDDAWINAFPEHASFMDETLIHHHLDYGPTAIPLPQTVHSRQPGWGLWHTEHAGGGPG